MRDKEEDRYTTRKEIEAMNLRGKKWLTWKRLNGKKLRRITT